MKQNTQKKKCPKCGSSITYKLGKRPRWKAGKVQRVQAYLCNNCGHQWTDKRI